MLEIFLRFVAVFVAMVAMDYTARYHKPIRVAFRRLASHKTACIIGMALFPVVIRLAMLPKLGPPDPLVHDEFSYLLGADTFAKGRMTNPPHPMWIHFETIHELFVPTYASKYPPGQALFLAVGQKITGSPWAGVLLSAAFMGSAMVWMLQGWLPPAWALLGALIGMANLTISTYWVDSYWGGCVAAGAGCLVMGAYPRLKKHARARDSILFALGLLLLANTRPYEGFVVGATAGIALLIHSIRKRTFRWAIPAVAVLAVGAALMGLYNYRVTGNISTMPYVASEKIYAVAPAFLFMPLRPVPHYNHEVLRKFWSEWDVDFYNKVMTHLEAGTQLKFEVLWQDFVRNWLMIIPLLVMPFLVTTRRGRFPLAAVLILICALVIQKGTLSHYAAPIAGTFYLVLVLALHRLYLWRPDGKPTGRVLANVVLVSCVFYLGYNLIHFGDGAFIGPTDFSVKRREVLAQLGQAPGSHLVIVRYTPDHELHDEWVYNGADIDGSRIVWARDMTHEKNQELLDYYRERKVWLLEPDRPHPKLTEIR